MQRRVIPHRREHDIPCFLAEPLPWENLCVGQRDVRNTFHLRGLGKQRNGPIGEITLTFLKQFMRFENFATGIPFDDA